MSAREVLVDERVVFSDADRTIHEWTITAGRFVARVPECPCGLVQTVGVVYQRDVPTRVERTYTVARTNCLCRSEGCHRRASTDRCHGWHRPRVERLVADIRKTFPGRSPR